MTGRLCHICAHDPLSRAPRAGSPKGRAKFEVILTRHPIVILNEVKNLQYFVHRWVGDSSLRSE